MREARLLRNGRCARCRRRNDRSVACDVAGIHTLYSAHDKAYTSVSFNDTLALEERGRAWTSAEAPNSLAAPAASGIRGYRAEYFGRDQRLNVIAFFSSLPSERRISPARHRR